MRLFPTPILHLRLRLLLATFLRTCAAFTRPINCNVESTSDVLAPFEVNADLFGMHTHTPMHRDMHMRPLPQHGSRRSAVTQRFMDELTARDTGGRRPQSSRGAPEEGRRGCDRPRGFIELARREKPGRLRGPSWAVSCAGAPAPCGARRPPPPSPRPRLRWAPRRAL